MLRSVRELEWFKVTGADGTHCGRIKDFYFNDSTWNVTHLILSIEPRKFGHKQVLLAPSHVSEGSIANRGMTLNLAAPDVERLPLAGSVLPVCRQYASMALSSPGARNFGRSFAEANPHLRSLRAIMKYQVNMADESVGSLADLIVDDLSWQIRYLAVEQRIDGKKLRFHILPQSVERFTWSTQRVILRHLQPVRLASGLEQVPFSTAA